MPASPGSLPRDRASAHLARQGGLLLLVGLLTGTALFHLVYGLARLPARSPEYLQCLAIGTIYTVVMTLCLKGTAHWMRGRVPLRSRWNVALHVGLQSIGTLVSFGLATGLVWGVLGDAVPLSSNLLLSVGAISFVTALVWNAFAYMRAFYRRLRGAEAAAHDARLQALRAQVNPHFLFNAFNSITALVQTRPREAQSVVVNLADLFRYTLAASRDDHATLADELEAARLYLSVEAVRFGDRLTVDLDVPDTLGSALLPGMVVQPLVENAVKHGVCRTLAPCTVRVTARREADTLRLCVTDTGPGFDTTDPAVVLARGTGLANVRERLLHFFDGAASLRLHPQGVELRAPLRRAAEAPPAPTGDRCPRSPSS